MAKRNRTTAKRKTEIRMEQGRGQGEKSDYKPWLTIQDVPSMGRVSRVLGWKTGRVHHLMSKLELSYFYILEWSPKVVDIREQFPLLPLERTIAIAGELGVRHPEDPKSKEPVVMTTDFLLTVDCGQRLELWARTLKPVANLGEREVQKYLIEKKFFEEDGINWGLVTDADIPDVLAENVEFIHDAYVLPESSYLNERMVAYVAPVLYKALIESSESLAQAALQQDELLGLEPGTCLFITKHMLARRKWGIDMNSKIQPSKHLDLQMIHVISEGREGSLA